MRRIALALLALAVLATAGCGFHLRGAAPAPTGFGDVAVRDLTGDKPATNWYAGRRDELLRTVRRAFADAGYALADTAPVTVELMADSLGRRIASIDDSASAAEYLVEYTLRYRIVAADGSALVPETELKADRSYRFREDAVMGSAEEEALLGTELRRDLAAQVVRQYRRRLQRLDASPVPAEPADAAAP